MAKPNSTPNTEFLNMEATQDSIIFFGFNTDQTKKNIDVFIERYNAKIKAETPEKYAKLRVKSAVVDTAKCLIDIFKANYFKPTEAGIVPERDFYICNSLVTGFKKQLSRTTVWRHILKLLEVGILTEKKLIHAKIGFTIKFNPDLIVINPNMKYTDLVCEVYKEETGAKEVDFTQRVVFQHLTPHFSQIPKFMIVSNCKQNIKEILIKNNIISGVFVENKNNFKSLPIGEANAPEKERNTEAMQKACHVEDLEAQKNISPAAAAPRKFASKKLRQIYGLPFQQQKNEDFEREKAIAEVEREMRAYEKLKETYVKSCITQVITLLYSAIELAPSQKRIIAEAVNKFFDEDFNINKKTSTYRLNLLYSEFSHRIYLTHQYVKNKPFGFVPLPYKYFDAGFEFGFAGTESWHKKTEKKKRHNIEWNNSFKKVNQFYLHFEKLKSKADPNAANFFNGAIIELQKHKSPMFAKMFTDFVNTSGADYNREYYQTSRQKFNQNAN